MRASVISLWANTSPTARGIFLMVFSTVLFAAMHASVRHVSDELSPLQIAFFRNFFGLLIFLPIAVRTKFGFLSTQRLGLHGVRAILNVLSMFAFFTALSMTPLARVTALSFTSPLFMAVISVVLLGEVMRVRRWSATILGFIGALIIIRPGVAEIDLGSLLVLGSALSWAMCMAVIKMLGRTESSMTITGYSNLLLSVMSLVPAVMVWKNPSVDAWFWLAVIGVIGTVGQIAVAEALKQADATAIMPFDFLKLIWAAAFGYFLFNQVPDSYTWVGAAIIFASGFYIAYRESRVNRKAKADKSEKAVRNNPR